MPVDNVYPPKPGCRKLYNFKSAEKDFLAGKWVKDAINHSMSTENTSQHIQENRAKEIFKEIANDLNFNIIKIFAFVLRKFIWKWIFERIEVNNFSKIKFLAKENYQIVYVPNHRSHIDYLMMLDAIGKNGLLPPVMAAGKNLDFFPVGYLLRKGCAFFVRRSFNRDQFYTAMMKEYVHYLLKERIPISFFPEGGRSRSGKLLSPKPGFFSFVVQSFLRSPEMKVVFVPTYIGYDRVLESRTYEKELKGAKKKKDSFFRFINFFRRLKKLHGNAYLSFGEPLFLKEFLEQNFPGEEAVTNNTLNTLEKIENEKPQWYFDAIDKLGRTIFMRINQSAVVSVPSMVSLALINAEGQKLKEDHLHNFINKMISLRKFSPISSNISLPSIKTHEFMKSIDKILPIRKSQQKINNIITNVITIKKKGLNNITYPLNNIFHLFAMESFIARLVSKYKKLDVKSILEYGTSIYPKIKDELYLPWNTNQIHEVITKTLDGMVKAGLLLKDANNYSPGDRNNVNFKYLEILSSAYLYMLPTLQP